MGSRINWITGGFMRIKIACYVPVYNVKLILSFEMYIKKYSQLQSEQDNPYRNQKWLLLMHFLDFQKNVDLPCALAR
jgi:hypothetical protein